LLLELFIRQRLELAALAEQHLVGRHRQDQILYLVRLHLLAAAAAEMTTAQDCRAGLAARAAEMAVLPALGGLAHLGKEIQAAQILLLPRFRLAAAEAGLLPAQMARVLRQALVVQERHPASLGRPLHMLVVVAAAAMAVASGLARAGLAAAAQAHLRAREIPEQQTLAAAAVVHQMLLLMPVALAALVSSSCLFQLLFIRESPVAHPPSPPAAPTPLSSSPHLGVTRHEPLR
jgi:hypothetical protein